MDDLATACVEPHMTDKRTPVARYVTRDAVLFRIFRMCGDTPPSETHQACWMLINPAGIHTLSNRDICHHESGKISQFGHARGSLTDAWCEVRSLIWLALCTAGTVFAAEDRWLVDPQVRPEVSVRE